MLQIYRLLVPALGPLDVEIDGLTLNARGSWQLRLANDAQIELGGGSVEAVLQRVQRFVRTLPQITTQYKRKADAIESADPRYEDGYALRLRGVTTGTAKAPAAVRPRR
eukprot:COSAG06_NODE_4506_length_4194_cov_3.158730_1_plen_109_part_00